MFHRSGDPYAGSLRDIPRSPDMSDNATQCVSILAVSRAMRTNDTVSKTTETKIKRHDRSSDCPFSHYPIVVCRRLCQRSDKQDVVPRIVKSKCDHVS
jgi:hypothetical protein